MKQYREDIQKISLFEKFYNHIITTDFEGELIVVSAFDKVIVSIKDLFKDNYSLSLYYNNRVKGIVLRRRTFSNSNLLPVFNIVLSHSRDEYKLSFSKLKELNRASYLDCVERVKRFESLSLEVREKFNDLTIKGDTLTSDYIHSMSKIERDMNSILGEVFSTHFVTPIEE
jgi:hypothetical protein